MHRSEINAFSCSITSISEVSTVFRALSNKKRVAGNLKILFYVYEMFVDNGDIACAIEPFGEELNVIYSLRKYKNLSIDKSERWCRVFSESLHAQKLRPLA